MRISSVSGNLLIVAFFCMSSLIFSRIVKRTIPWRTMSSAARSMSSGASSPAVLNMTSAELFKILQNDESRTAYQIVDVREPHELQVASLPYAGVIRLPLSQSNTWAGPLLENRSSILDPTKATVCVCHHGMRSMRMANFLRKLYLLNSHCPSNCSNRNFGTFAMFSL